MTEPPVPGPEPLEPAEPLVGGRYRLLETIGQGGMGVVYRGQDVHTGQAVAVKTVRVPQAETLEGLRREIHALARLRHPGVVRILGEGLHEGLPWYAMELIEGQTLRRHMQRLRPPGAAEMPETPTAAAAEPPTRPARVGHPEAATRGRPPGQTDPGAATRRGEPLAARASPPPASVPPRTLRARLLRPLDLDALGELLTIVRRLCRTLAFLHGEGIVHRDLKPSNILLRAASGEWRAASEQQQERVVLAARSSQLAALWPVLFDFGLVTQFRGELSREALQLAGGTVGTTAYMAPEQVHGELVDARADLYALGCILYEILVGRPPFVAHSPEQVLWMHLKHEPLPPGELVEGVPRELEEVILRLLAKRPQDRLGHAHDVAAVLARMGAADWPDAAALPAARAYLYRPALAGRAGVLERLEAHLGRPGGVGLVLLGGESGVGKTRLLLELGHRAAERGFAVLTGQCQAAAPDLRGEAAAGGPLEALRRPLQQVADRCRELGALEAQRLIGRHAAVLSLYQPELTGLPGLAAAGEPAELPPEAARLRLFVVLSEMLGALAEAAPVLLVLDDLQWADELTLGALSFIVRALRLRKRSVLVLGAYRTEEADTTLRRLLESSSVEALELGRLDEAAVGQIVADMLALWPPPALFVRFLSRHSEGNPFFVAEYLRAALEEGLLRRSESGRWQVEVPEEAPEGSEDLYEALPLPRSLRELVGRRLAGLSAEARAFVEAAAVLGREGVRRQLAEVAGISLFEAMRATLELTYRQVLEPAEAGRLRFVHDKLREVAYERIEPERRCALHRRAAETLEAAGATSEATSALGRHWEQAGEPALARRWYLEAARAALRRTAQAEAERHYAAYLALVTEPARESIEAATELGELLAGLPGRVREAGEHYEQALAAARALGDRWAEAETLSKQGTLEARRSRFGKSRQLLEQALEMHRACGNRAGEAWTLNRLAGVFDEDGEQTARELYGRALELHRQGGDLKGEASVLSNLASLHRNLGRPDEARGLYEQALAIARQLGDRRSEGMYLGNLATLHADFGLLEAARALFEQAIAIARQVGNRVGEGIHLGNLGLILASMGHSAEACRLYEAALAIKRELDDRKGELITLGNLALARHEQGDPPAARSLFDEVLAIARALGSEYFQLRALWGLGRLERQAAGDLPRAAELQGRAAALAREANSLHRVLAICELGHVELAEGRPAGELLAEARSLASQMSAGEKSEVGRALGRLERASEAARSGKGLFRGELFEDLPAGLRRWLEGAGEL
jgi:serine/threonine protein kinase/predicted ATPase